MTASATLSDFRISTWLSTVAECNGTSTPSGDCCCTCCDFRLSTISSAMLEYFAGAVAKYAPASAMQDTRTDSISGYWRRMSARSDANVAANERTSVSRGPGLSHRIESVLCSITPTFEQTGFRGPTDLRKVACRCHGRAAPDRAGSAAATNGRNREGGTACRARLE